MFVRAVDIHEPLADVGEDVQGRRRTVDKLAVRARVGERTLNDELGVFAGFEAVFVEQAFERSFQFGDVENRFDRTGIGSTANEGAVGAVAEDEIERADKDGFARASFAGDHIVTGLEFQREIRNQREVFYAEGSEHAKSVERVASALSAGCAGYWSTSPRLLRRSRTS